MTPPPITKVARATRKSSSPGLGGKRMLLTSWLSTKPFVNSFVEDQRKGTAKETRKNTLSNMHIPKVSPAKQVNSTTSSRTESNLSATSSESLPSLSKLSTPAHRSPNRTISFSTKVKIYSFDNPRNPIEEDVKEPSPIPPLEVRLKRSKSSRAVDIRQPLTPVARWLLRKTSNL